VSVQAAIKVVAGRYSPPLDNTAQAIRANLLAAAVITTFTGERRSSESSQGPLTFWISLVLSCTVQLLVGYWLNVHPTPQTRNELKGAAVLAIVPGYAVGNTVIFSCYRS
jgi:hypothetical protein